MRAHEINVLFGQVEYSIEHWSKENNRGRFCLTISQIPNRSLDVYRIGPRSLGSNP